MLRAAEPSIVTKVWNRRQIRPGHEVGRTDGQGSSVLCNGTLRVKCVYFSQDNVVNVFICEMAFLNRPDNLRICAN